MWMCVLLREKRPRIRPYVIFLLSPVASPPPQLIVLDFAIYELVVAPMVGRMRVVEQTVHSWLHPYVCQLDNEHLEMLGCGVRRREGDEDAIAILRRSRNMHAKSDGYIGKDDSGDSKEAISSIS